MPFLDEIVTQLNTNWKDNLPSYIPEGMQSRFCGIAETIIEPIETSQGERIKKYPAIVGLDGDAVVDETRNGMIDIDDDYALNIYHRIESIANSSTKQGFGDTIGDMQEIANMGLMVIAFRNKSNIVAHKFEAFLKDSLPVTTKITIDGSTVQTSIFKIGNSSFDKLQLLAREYAEVEVNYPELVVFEMKYQIQSIWKKRCFINN